MITEQMHKMCSENNVIIFGLNTTLVYIQVQIDRNLKRKIALILFLSPKKRLNEMILFSIGSIIHFEFAANYDTIMLFLG